MNDVTSEWEGANNFVTNNTSYLNTITTGGAFPPPPKKYLIWTTLGSMNRKMLVKSGEMFSQCNKLQQPR